MTLGLNVLSSARALADHAVARQDIVARNVANADTPGYRAADLPRFREVFAQDDGIALRTSRAGHVVASGDGPDLRARPTADPADPNGNSVSVETEMMRAAEIRHDYDLAMGIYRASLDILRLSLGR
jgi:flagellar basal-body rod protein FlgB